MTPQQPFLGLALLACTVAAYILAYRLSHAVRPPAVRTLLHPIPVSAASLILLLHLTKLPFTTYRPVQDFAGLLLGPATIALAVPVYRQRARLRTLALPFAISVTVGTLTTIGAALGLSALAHLATPVRHTLAFKSVTTAIAVELVKLYGGNPSLVAVFVVFTGITGALVGPAILTRCGIRDPAARGVALGTISHAIGTVAALGESETTGALSSLAMIGGAVVTTLVAPFYLPLLLSLTNR
jgi:putative effector of murein hydrolase